MIAARATETYAKLQEAYERFVREEDLSPLLGEQASQWLQELFEWLTASKKFEPDGPPVAGVAALLAHIHWSRWRYASSHEYVGELDRALLSAFRLRDINAAPAPLRPLVAQAQQAMLTKPPDPVLLHDYAGSLLELAERYGSQGALAEGIHRFAQVLELVSEGDPMWPIAASNFGGAVLLERRLTGTTEQLERAIELARRALDRLEVPNEEHAQFMDQLGQLLVARYREAGRLADVDEAIAIWTRASELEGVPEEIARAVFTNLGTALFLRHLESEGRDDLDRALRLLNRGIPDVELSRPVPPEVGLLVSVWRRRGKLTGDAGDLLQALYLQRLLVAERGSADNHSTLAGIQEQLYSRTGQAEILDESVDTYKKAIALAESSGSASAEALSGLAWSLKLRFDSFNNETDRDDAITAARQSVALTPQNHASLGNRLAILAAALTSRSMTTGSTPDLVEGMRVIDRALALPDQSNENRALQLFNKSALIAVRNTSGWNWEDINVLIDLCQQAVGLLPDGHPKKGVYRTNLMAAHLARYQHNHEQQDLEAVLQVGTTALTEIPEDHPRRVAVLSNQALALIRSAEKEFNEPSLRQAVRFLTEALALFPEGTTPDARLLVNRAAAQFLCRQPEDIELALNDWSTAARNETAPPSVRLEAANQWARHSAQLGRWETAVEAYSVAVDLLTSVAGRQLERDDQEAQLFGRSQITAEAAAAALETSNPEKALELLEAGRCVQWNHHFQSAGELALLADVRPDLATKLEHVTTALRALWSRPTEFEALADSPGPRDP
ncbi:hypothetical protein [Streptomyces mirabilis]|uniref:hypothetical protein n=1 Tax=Streptomyces mirabilis TaxID=68239 RepID=UPI003253D9C3